MACLSDTNILLRWAQPLHPDYPTARTAVERLQERGEELFITPQNLIEFWNAATRPGNRNGSGLSPAQAEVAVRELETFFLLAPDNAAVYPAWRHLVTTVGVSGVQVHDARLVAVMLVHGLTHLLTFNTGDFLRYPGITVMHPRDIAAPP